MNVAVILKEKGHDVATTSAKATLQEAASQLAARRIGALVVLEDGRISGILSERDLVGAIGREGPAALSRTVGDVMSKKVATCDLNDSIGELMDRMTEGRFRHLPVVEGGKMIGIVSIGDVVKHRIAETVMEAEAMKLYIAQN